MNVKTVASNHFGCGRWGARCEKLIRQNNGDVVINEVIIKVAYDPHDMEKTSFGRVVFYKKTLGLNCTQ